MKQERRRYHRTTVPLDITLETAGREWSTKTLNLSPYGVKVAGQPAGDPLRPGTNVQLRLLPADEHAALLLEARVERTDHDGIALSFPGLRDETLRRLKALVDALLLQEWREVAAQLGAKHPPEGAQAVHEGPASRRRSLEGTHPPKQKGPPQDEASERDRWQAVLRRLGLQDLQLPPDGPLARQWREFLKRHEGED